MLIKGIDVVACVSIAVCGLLVFTGHDGSIIALLSSIIGYYFGRKSKGSEQGSEE